MSEDDLSMLRALVLAYAGGDWWVREPLLALLNALLEAERASGSGG